MVLFNVFRAEDHLHIEIKWVAGGDWKKGELLLEQKGSIAVGVFSVELSIDLPSFNGLCSNLAKIALFIYLIKYWVECMTSSVISFAGICIR